MPTYEFIDYTGRVYEVKMPYSAMEVLNKHLEIIHNENSSKQEIEEELLKLTSYNEEFYKELFVDGYISKRKFTAIPITNKIVNGSTVID